MRCLLLAALLCVVQGKICDPRELLRTYFESEQHYIECVPLKENDESIGLGLWVRRKCADGSVFVEVRQACVDREQLRRERGLCRIEKGLSFCDTTECVVLTQEDALLTCNWMEDPMRPVEDSDDFHQCMPLEYGRACGRWVKQACPEGTKFNVDLQTCLRKDESEICGEKEFPGAKCSDDSDCSSGVACKQGVCCETVAERIPEGRADANGTRRGYNGFNLPTCPSTNQRAISTCSGGCPSNCGCYKGGCCPLATCQTGVLAGSVCGSGGSGGCGGGQNCYLGSCCPRQQVQQQQQQQVMISVAATCPSGGPSQGSCSQGCPSNCGCYNNVCCPKPKCPTGGLAPSFCGSGCQGQCYQGGCCPQQLSQTSFQQQQQQPFYMQLRVTCPTGVQSSQPCSSGCGSGSSCYQGACCPLATCPSGQQSSGFCGSSGCGARSSCYQGCCCQQPQQQVQVSQAVIQLQVSCPNGGQSQGSCSSGCPSNCGCYQGQCCPYSQCPSGGTATSFCNNGCSSGQQCHQGCCCGQQQQQQQPYYMSQPQVQIGIAVTCPTGVQSNQPCSSGCGNNQGCYQGACCPYSQCPSGGYSNKFCGGGSSCGGGQSCYQGCCCGQQQQHQQQSISIGIAVTCPNGQQSSRPCSSGCGSGQGCYQGACCGLSQCPSGGRATGFCNQGCNSGQSCYQGCCCNQQQPQQQQQQIMIGIGVTCPNGQRSNRPCSSGCSANQGCYNGGCCNYPSCGNGNTASGFCNQGCGSGQSCQNGGCCQQQQVVQPIQFAVGIAVTCPTGVQSNQPCSSGCGNNQGCYQGACCPYSQCPSGGQASGFCNQGCGSGQSCYQGCCCGQQQQQQQQQIMIGIAVTCPTGVQSNRPCSSGCGNNQGCYQGACCPYSQCPTGGYANSFCGGGNSCGGGQSCHQGCCCGQQQQQQQQQIRIGIAVTCPTGVQSNQPCSSGCGSNQGCYQGACCPYSQCPSGGYANRFCSGGNSCGGGQSCYQGCCCGQQQQPQQQQQIMIGIAVTCPTGVQSNQPCSSGCGTNQGCYQGACCPYSQCPSGGYASSFCGGGNSCGGGQSCHQGCCCGQQQQQQPSVQIGISFGQQQSTCGDGGAPVVSYGGGCPSGYQQSGFSGCCPSQSFPTQSFQGCSQGQTQVCGCSASQRCPKGSSCSGSVCCGQVQQQTYPGSSCSGGCGSNMGCQSGSCQCNQGYCSNGVGCVPATKVFLSFSPRPSCGGCGRRYKDSRNENDEFFPPLDKTKRVCTKHCTCTPDEVCVEGTCLKRLSPGQIGCTHDEQCSHDCSTASCDVATRTCRCSPGLYTFVDFGLCFKKCPVGTEIVEGRYCKPKLSLKILSRNRLTREQIESTHTCGPIAKREC